MTTGRINQVTILSLGTEVRRQTPRRERVYQVRRHRSDPSRRSVRAKSSNSATDRFNCPHWVPQEMVRNEPYSTFYRRNISVTYNPQEEKTYALSRTNTRKLGKVVPKDLVNIWQSQQSTDPKWCPPKVWRGFGSRYKIRCSVNKDYHPGRVNGVAEPLTARCEEQASPAAIEETRLAIKRLVARRQLQMRKPQMN